MKRLLCLLYIAGALLGAALHGQITPLSVTGSGTYQNSASLLTDGVTPAESTYWQDPSTVWWYGSEPIFTIDLGAAYQLSGITWSVDNNDSYRMEVSADGSLFSTLFTIGIDDGNVQVSPGGMDTMSSDPGSAEFVSSMVFAQPVAAQYLRVSAVGGDGSYAAGEVTAYGTAIPESSTYAALFGAATLAFVLWRRRVGRR